MSQIATLSRLRGVGLNPDRAAATLQILLLEETDFTSANYFVADECDYFRVTDPAGQHHYYLCKISVKDLKGVHYFTASLDSNELPSSSLPCWLQWQ